MLEDFADTIAALQAHIRSRRQAIPARSSEGLKTALVLPFIRALGYDVFDPFQVIPGFASDEGGKVDYAVRHDESGDMRLLVSLSANPDDLASERAQLLATAMRGSKAACGILTNGSQHRVYAADAYHVLTPEPVLMFDLAGGDVDPAPLHLLSSDAFDVAALIATAHQRRLAAAVADALEAELSDPTRLLMDAVVTRLGEEPEGLREILLAAARRRPGTEQVAETPVPPQGDRRQMSEDEETAFHVIRAIAARDLDPTRVVARPAKSYTAVLLDDNHHRTIARLHFNSSRKYVGTFREREETRNQIPGSRGVYDHEDAIRTRIAELEAEPQEIGGATDADEHTE